MSTDYKERLVVTHPVSSMADIFTGSNLIEDIDFWIERDDDEHFVIRGPNNLHQDAYYDQRIHMPPNIMNTKYTLTIVGQCLVATRAPFVTKNTTMLSLL